MEVHISGPTDRWAAVEEGALSAFEHYTNHTEGINGTLRRAAHYAKIDEVAREIVIDKRAFVLGLVSYGLLETPSLSYGNTATWVGLVP